MVEGHLDDVVFTHERRIEADRPGENQPRECGMLADMKFDGRPFLGLQAGLLERAYLAHCLFGTLGQFADNVVRQAGRQPLPIGGQNVDEELLTGLERVDLVLICQSEANCAAVRVAPRNRDVIAHVQRNVIDSHVDRFLEGNAQDTARHHRIIVGQQGSVGKRQHHTAIARGRDDLERDRFQLLGDGRA